MEDYTSIFSENIEVPNIVMKKAECALSRIKMEGKTNMEDNTFRKRLLKRRAAIVAGVAILAAGSMTAVAAIHHVWDRGMQGMLQTSDEQQQTLTNQGVAKIMSEQEKYADMAVTVGGITVTPEVVVADDQFLYMSFSVSGYDLEQGKEPCFEYFSVYEENHPFPDPGIMNSYGAFYNGIVSDENGKGVYEDGSDVILDENGRVIEYFVDKNGEMQFTIESHILHKEDSFLGKTIHVDLGNIGTVYKGDYTNYMDGDWNFAIEISNEKSTQEVAVNQEVKGTGFTIDTIEITPVSIRLNYSVTGEVVIQEDVNEIPLFRGVVLKDGTRLPYLFNGGTSGYTDETMEHAYMMSGFERVIEISEIQSLLLVKEGTNDLIEVPIQ